MTSAEARADWSFGDWWHDVGAAALVGTARRAVPDILGADIVGVASPIPAPTGRSDEALLTAAALGAAVLRAGRRAASYRVRQPADQDQRAEAPAVAVQLLELVLTQPPAGAPQGDGLLQHWLLACGGARRRVPHALLPTILDRATAARGLRPAAAAVVDRRGEWLARQRPEWAWFAEALAGQAAAQDETIDADAWARLPSAERPGVVAQVRTVDPSRGRLLVESTWSSDGATARRAHLEALRIGLGPDDEALLERALDDRAASVRELAATLLDALPTSARAQRMADRLRPLLHRKGRPKRTLEVTLPDEPDATAKRDGLGRPPRGRSARGWWLERLAAGAPLTSWTEATGADPATTLSRLSDEDALSGIRAAVRSRRDRAWAAALLTRAWDATLLPALAPAEREEAVLSRLAAGDVAAAIAALDVLSTPWSARFSLHVLAALGAAKAPTLRVADGMAHLLAGLHPDALVALESWVGRVGDDHRLAGQLRNLLQFHSVKRSVTEAFR